ELETKALGIPHPGEGEDGSPGEPVEGERLLASERAEAEEARPQPHLRHVGRPPSDGFGLAVERLFRDGLRSRPGDEVGDPKRRERLTEKSGWKGPIARRRPERVEEDEVEVASEPDVLEAIVENDRFSASVDRPSRRRDAIGILDVRNVGQVLREEKRLVVSFRRMRTVSAADDRRTKPAARELSAEELDGGRLPRAAAAQVPDAQHGTGDRGRARAHDAPAKARGERVRNREGQEKRRANRPFRARRRSISCELGSGHATPGSTAVGEIGERPNERPSGAE